MFELREKYPQPTPPLTQTVAQVEEKIVVTFHGEIDLATAPRARKVLLQQCASTHLLIVDLHDVAYMDSSGIATLVETFQLLRKKEGRLVLVAVTQAVARVLSLSRLDKVFTLKNSLEEAFLTDTKLHSNG